MLSSESEGGAHVAQRLRDLAADGARQRQVKVRQVVARVRVQRLAEQLQATDEPLLLQRLDATLAPLDVTRYPFEQIAPLSKKVTNQWV